MRLANKITIATLSILTLFILSLELFSFLKYRQDIVRQVGESSLDLAESIGCTIDGDRFAQYNKTEIADLYYSEITSQLDRIKEKTGVTYLYTMADAGDDFKYIMEGHAPGEEAEDVLGDMDPKAEYDNSASEALLSGEGRYSDIYYNGPDYGYLLSAFAPIKSSNGQTVGIVGVDVSANDVNTRIWGFLIVLAGIALVLGIIVFLLLNLMIKKSIINPVTELSGIAGRFAVGDFGAAISDSITERKDEIGELAGSFHKMFQNMRETASYAENISAGNIDLEIHVKSDEDVLNRSIKKVVDTLQSLISEMRSMTALHEQGEIDAVIEDSKFEGSFRLVASGINTMAKGHIDMNRKAMDCIAEFSRGNFEAELERFSGKRVFINDNIELMRRNLKSLITDVDMLVSAGVEGRLSARADASRQYGDYNRIIDGINRTLDAVVEPLRESASVLQQMAANNLSVEVEGEYNGDHADIKNAINKMLDALNSLLGDIQVAAEQVLVGTKQVSLSSQSLSQGATEQASAIEELTASLTEIAAQTRQNALNASRANELAIAARDSAVSGNDRMGELQQAMAEINDASASISKIIKVIDEIAFQTNLLALNAAVEAARAGQHGKGFAVVAEEVRNLAQRSAAAAKETTSMIEESIKKTKEGTRMADETARALNQIVNGVEKATGLVGEIARASNDQATAVAQVNKGIEQVSQVVQTNSATAEESAAASEELSSQAQILKEMVGRFSLRGQSLAGGQKAGFQPAAQGKTLPEGKGKPKVSLKDNDFGKY